MSGYYRRPKPLPVTVQAEALRKYRETISVETKGPCDLRWRGIVSPAEYAETYVIDLEYTTSTRYVPRPRVYAVEPRLKLRDGVGCPHRHGENEPCVYFHHGDEWGPDKLIAHTIIPWTSRWLYFYEIWLATGVWMGGGISHKRV